MLRATAACCWLLPIPQRASTRTASIESPVASRQFLTTDDELVVLRVQYLRRNRQLRQALAVINSLIARNPRAPNAWVQKARIETELGLGPDFARRLIAALGMMND